MKVVHVVMGKANPERMNGVNAVVHNIASSQCRQGCDVEVWGLTEDPNAPTPAREYRLRLFTRPRFRLLPSRALIRAVAELAKLHRADSSEAVFHLHGALLPEFYGVTRLLLVNRLPWVVAPHGAYNRESLKKNKWIKRAFIALVDRAIIRKARAVHVLHRDEISGVPVAARHPRVVEIPNGFSAPEEIPLPPAVNDERPIVGFCGRLSARHKGLDLLLEGFALFKREGRAQGTLWLIGDGPDRSELEAYAQVLGIAEHVKFFGPRFGPEKEALLVAADAFIHVSRWEGMPMAVLEAAAYAKPLLLSVETNLAEKAFEAGAGLTIKPNDATRIASCLRKFAALPPPEIRAMGAAARKMIVERFTWAEVVHALANAAYPTDVSGCIRRGTIA